MRLRHGGRLIRCDRYARGVHHRLHGIDLAVLAPDSHVLFQRGYNRTSLGIGVASYESFDTVAGVNASPQAVFDYYKQQRAQRGWQGPVSEDLNATTRWTRGAYEFSIAFLGRPGDPTYPGESNYTTTYSFGVQYAPNLASPASTS
jgi:hypothetical protein